MGETGEEGERVSRRREARERTMDMVLTGLWTLIPLEYYAVVRPPFWLVRRLFLAYHTINPACYFFTLSSVQCQQQPTLFSPKTVWSGLSANYWRRKSLIERGTAPVRDCSWPTSMCLSRMTENVYKQLANQSYLSSELTVNVCERSIDDHGTINFERTHLPFIGMIRSFPMIVGSTSWGE